MADSEAENREILRKGFDEFRRFVNPLIFQRAQLSGEAMRYVATRGGALVDDEDRTYEDFHGTQALGHRHPAVTEAIRSFLESDAPSWYPSRVNPFAGRFARALCERSGYERAFFGCTGADSVDAALKLCRAATRRPRLIGLEGAYHGCTFGATALMPAGPFRDPFEPHLPGVASIPAGAVDALAAALAPGDVAAVIVEPIQGSCGVSPLSAEFVAALCARCEETGTLIVADEVQTGLGRSGRFLYSSTWPRRPAVVCMAKALGGGLMPISAVLTTAEVFSQAYGREFESAESHNATFSYNALSCVAGLAALDLLDDALIDSARRKGEVLRDELERALDGSELFARVHGDGLMVGLELRDVGNPWLSFESFGLPDFADRPSIGPLLCMRLYKRGFLCYVCGHDWSTVRLQPRLDIDVETLREFCSVCREELDHLERLA